jgi:serine/threonine protein kinase
LGCLLVGYGASIKNRWIRRHGRADRYTFEEQEIGAGGFGKVRRGRDNSLDRCIAAKSLDPILRAFSEAEQERFRREARTLAKLSHPNIPAVYDVNFTPEKFEIIFQFIEGQNLRAIIEGNGPTQVGLARQWFQQIASALEHAHKNGVIHRDIKPENIIITPDMQTASLVDFGIALSAEEAK